MAEFSVLPNFRRKGAGTLFALDVIHKHPGKWHIEYNIKNNAGKKFWNKLILNLVGAHYKKDRVKKKTGNILSLRLGKSNYFHIRLDLVVVLS